MHGRRLRRHFIQAKRAGSAKFVTWTWKDSTLVQQRLKDRIDEEHVYTFMPSILHDLASAATLMVYEESASSALWRARTDLAGEGETDAINCVEHDDRDLGSALPARKACYSWPPAIRNRAETACSQCQSINDATIYQHHGAYGTKHMTFRRQVDRYYGYQV